MPRPASRTFELRARRRVSRLKSRRQPIAHAAIPLLGVALLSSAVELVGRPKPVMLVTAPVPAAAIPPAPAATTPIWLSRPAIIYADGNVLSYRAGPTRTGVMGLRTATSNACPAADGGRGAIPWGDGETAITLFFTADSTAGHWSHEFTLWRQVTDSMPVPMVRHVRRDGHQPFLEYRYVVPTDDGEDSLAVVPHAYLPISRRDTVANRVDVRALRAVEWHFLVAAPEADRPKSQKHPTTDHANDTDAAVRVDFVTPLPAVTQLDRRACRAVTRDPPVLARDAERSAGEPRLVTG